MVSYELSQASEGSDTEVVDSLAGRSRGGLMATLTDTLVGGWTA